MDLTFSEQIAAHLAANLVTVGFVFAVVHGLKHKANQTPWLIWAGLMLPLLFIVAAYVTTGEWADLRGG